MIANIRAIAGVTGARWALAVCAGLFTLAHAQGKPEHDMGRSSHFAKASMSDDVSKLVFSIEQIVRRAFGR